MSIAFFDVDGTLLPHPSLERRFAWELFRQRRIRSTNCFRWAIEALRLTRASVGPALANKMYLRGIRVDACCEAMKDQRRSWLPEFFPAAIQRVWWHALRGDAIVLVTGTLAPLAELVKAKLQRELIWRGVETEISVIATRLQLRGGHFTGRVAGPLMLGAAKADAMREFAYVRGLALSRCSTYGDSAADRWMLASVANAYAVNPSLRLKRIAQRSGWSVMRWHTPWPRGLSVRQFWQWKGQAAR